MVQGSSYERELKEILHGNSEWLAHHVRAYPNDVQENYLKICEIPFIVTRAAGSFGVDLIAIRNELSFPIEVKTSSTPNLPFTANSGRGMKQVEWMIEECERAGLIPLYAFKLKKRRNEDPWRIFTTTCKTPMGNLRVLQAKMPKLSVTKQGNIIMRWEEGMPLHKFIDYLSFLYAPKKME